MSVEALVRPARAEDREPVLAFCRDTFDWGDYIHEVWEDWLAAPDGALLVAELDGRPVAVGRAALAAPGEGWLEGLRVHPAYRRRGLADAMNRAGQAWLRERGAAVARLASWRENEPPQRQVQRLGFRPVAEFEYWTVQAALGPEPAASRAPLPVPATAVAAAGLWARATASPVLASAGGLFAAGWQWRRLAPEDLATAVAGRRALLAGEAFALLHDGAEGPRVAWLDGDPAGWPALLSAARRRAAAAGRAHASALLPSGPALAAAAREAGFGLDTAFRIFARDLVDPA